MLRETTAMLRKLKSNPVMPVIPRIRIVQPLFWDNAGRVLETWIYEDHNSEKGRIQSVPFIKLIKKHNMAKNNKVINRREVMPHGDI
jgi:hypothetical protein